MALRRSHRGLGLSPQVVTDFPQPQSATSLIAPEYEHVMQSLHSTTDRACALCHGMSSMSKSSAKRVQIRDINRTSKSASTMFICATCVKQFPGLQPSKNFPGLQPIKTTCTECGTQEAIDLQVPMLCKQGTSESHSICMHCLRIDQSLRIEGRPKPENELIIRRDPSITVPCIVMCKTCWDEHVAEQIATSPGIVLKPQRIAPNWVINNSGTSQTPITITNKLMGRIDTIPNDVWRCFHTQWTKPSPRHALAKEGVLQLVLDDGNCLANALLLATHTQNEFTPDAFRSQILAQFQALPQEISVMIATRVQLDIQLEYATAMREQCMGSNKHKAQQKLLFETIKPFLIQQSKIKNEDGAEVILEHETKLDSMFKCDLQALLNSTEEYLQACIRNHREYASVEDICIPNFWYDGFVMQFLAPLVLNIGGITTITISKTLASASGQWTEISFFSMDTNDVDISHLLRKRNLIKGDAQVVLVLDCVTYTTPHYDILNTSAIHDPSLAPCFWRLNDKMARQIVLREREALEQKAHVEVLEWIQTLGNRSKMVSPIRGSLSQNTKSRSGDEFVFSGETSTAHEESSNIVLRANDRAEPTRTKGALKAVQRNIGTKGEEPLPKEDATSVHKVIPDLIQQIVEPTTQAPNAEPITQEPPTQDAEPITREVGVNCFYDFNGNLIAKTVHAKLGAKGHNKLGATGGNKLRAKAVPEEPLLKEDTIGVLQVDPDLIAKPITQYQHTRSRMVVQPQVTSLNTTQAKIPNLCTKLLQVLIFAPFSKRKAKKKSTKSKVKCYTWERAVGRSTQAGSPNNFEQPAMGYLFPTFGVYMGEIAQRVCRTKVEKWLQVAFAIAAEIIETVDPEWSGDHKDFVVQFSRMEPSDFCKQHIDRHNVSHAYALSLGSYSGGELICYDKQHTFAGKVIESKHANRTSISTHNSIVKFEGRLKHSVGTINSGVRFSIIWYKKWDRRLVAPETNFLGGPLRVLDVLDRVRTRKIATIFQKNEGITREVIRTVARRAPKRLLNVSYLGEEDDRTHRIHQNFGVFKDGDWIRVFGEPLRSSAQRSGAQQEYKDLKHQIRENHCQEVSEYEQSLLCESTETDPIRKATKATKGVIQAVQAILKREKVYERCGLHGYRLDKVEFLFTTPGGHQQWWHTNAKHSVIMNLGDSSTLLCKLPSKTCNLLTHEGECVVLGPNFNYARATYSSDHIQIQANLVLDKVWTSNDEKQGRNARTNVRRPSEFENQCNLPVVRYEEMLMDDSLEAREELKARVYKKQKMLKMLDLVQFDSLLQAFIYDIHMYQWHHRYNGRTYTSPWKPGNVMHANAKPPCSFCKEDSHSIRTCRELWLKIYGHLSDEQLKANSMVRPTFVTAFGGFIDEGASKIGKILYVKRDLHFCT